MSAHGRFSIGVAEEPRHWVAGTFTMHCSLNSVYGLRWHSSAKSRRIAEWDGRANRTRMTFDTIKRQ